MILVFKKKGASRMGIRESMNRLPNGGLFNVLETMERSSLANISSTFLRKEGMHSFIPQAFVENCPESLVWF